MPLLKEDGSYLLQEDGTYRLLTETETAPWPPDVNTYARTGTYSEQIDTNFSEFAPEVGPPKRRRRMSISSDTITFSTWMRSAEYASFLDFYRTVLADGTLPFLRARPRTGTTETFVFVGQAPSVKDVGYNLYEVQMTMKNVP